jgi:hypothetical protein
VGGVLDVIPPELFTGGGLAGLVATAVWMIYTGRLVPRRVYEDMKTERDDWKKAAETRSEQNAAIGKQVEKLVEQGQTAERAMLSLQTLVQQIRGGQ